MISSFSKFKCSLGEGIVWHPETNSILWVDINQNKVFKKRVNSTSIEYDACWILDETPTAVILSDSSDSVLLLTERRLANLTISSGELSTIVNLSLPDGVRTNDAGVGPSNTIWFGTMESSPSGINGNIYIIDSDLVVHDTGIKMGIPNTFLWDQRSDLVYVSDSYVNSLYGVRFNKGAADVNKIYCVEDSSCTPDGGCHINSESFVVAHWGAAQLRWFNKGGLYNTSDLPVLQPTNCCVINQSGCTELYVTSATEGLSEFELDKYPKSGELIKIKLNNKFELQEPIRWVTKN
ncbi:SMP-30/gluconolactonase/LRE family protein [Shewanella sp. WXL01]|uniref:SMP-30/gluconolactonase/LRE family protein n=1 Tax=Shewanella sp. WXL01 TaxID=2709721 RepID=UPI0014385B33|nr:SMP-30/gluconolactonase/LRE family protein [Shewanella sp. WXL01]NKF50074.1 SMP-30/gluconolactonase/LRE family protein [Shewanella sp. WXL01]